MRVISLDCGIQCSGVVVANVSSDNVEIIHLAFVTSCIYEYCLSEIHQYVDPYKTLVLYENLYMPKLKTVYQNWPVMNIQKRIRSYFLQQHANVRALFPSQKVGLIPGEKSKNRKKRAEDYVTTYLSTFSDKRISEKYNALSRKHDVADALLGVLYAQRYLLPK